MTCKGSYRLGTACGNCSRCEAERAANGGEAPASICAGQPFAGADRPSAAWIHELHLALLDRLRRLWAAGAKPDGMLILASPEDYRAIHLSQQAGITLRLMGIRVHEVRDLSPSPQIVAPVRP